MKRGSEGGRGGGEEGGWVGERQRNASGLHSDKARMRGSLSLSYRSSEREFSADSTFIRPTRHRASVS
eukprot:2569232-Pleurochrysis_carterae.AAC.1